MTNPDRVSSASLRTSVREATSTAEQIEAFDTLLATSERHPTRFLADVAVDDDVAIDIRLRAVAALGVVSTDAAKRGLIAALDSSSQSIVRRAVERLGVLPGTEQLEALKAVRTGNTVTREALRWAKLLVSYRNRLGEYKLPTSFRLVEPETDAAEQLQVAAPTRSVRSELEAITESPVLGLRVTSEGTAAFSCGGRSFVSLMSSDLAREGPTWLTIGQAIPAVVMQRSLETGHWVASHVVLTDPGRDGRVRVCVARRSGPVVLAGEATIDGDVAAFALAATRSPYLPPTKIGGRFDGARRTVVIDRFTTSRVLSADQVRLTRNPTRQEGPTLE